MNHIMGDRFLIITLVLATLALPAFSRAQVEQEAEQAATPGIEGSVTFFYYPDIEAVAPFYGGILQLPMTMDTDWVKIFRITPSSSVGLVQQGRGFHEVSEDKPAMLSIVTNEVDAWYARIKASGTVILKELPPPDAEASAGSAPVRGFIAQDPGGYTVEFFSWQQSPTTSTQ
jgi:predicted enzyme related to lactoylglutathione lyase